jgi:hypothetical protein
MKQNRLYASASGISKKLLYNKFVLYAIFAVALLNLWFAASKKDYMFVALFILVGFLTSFFCKNMIVILLFALALANIIRVVVRGEAQFEGMEDGVPSEGEQGEQHQKEEKKIVHELKSDAEDLIDTQEKIIDGFAKIEPYMNRAEDLITKIDNTAKKISETNEAVKEGATARGKTDASSNGDVKPVSASQPTKAPAKPPTKRTSSM